MTPFGIKPPTFQLVVQCLNQNYATACPSTQIKDKAIHVKTSSIYDPSATSMICRMVFQVFHNCDSIVY
jgi:hypothetical protein